MLKCKDKLALGGFVDLITKFCVAAAKKFFQKLQLFMS